MTAKHFLSRGFWLKKRIDKKVEQRDALYDRLTNTSPNYEGDGAQSTKDPHKFDGLAELDDEIQRMKDDLNDILLEILEVISRVENEKARDVLRSYYHDMLTWDKVAERCQISTAVAVIIRDKATKDIKL